MFKKTQIGIGDVVVDLNNLYFTKKQLKITLAELDSKISEREQVVVANVGEAGQVSMTVNGVVYVVKTAPQSRTTVKYAQVVNKILEFVKVRAIIAKIRELIAEHTSSFDYVKVDINVVQQ